MININFVATDGNRFCLPITLQFEGNNKGPCSGQNVFQQGDGIPCGAGGESVGK